MVYIYIFLFIVLFAYVVNIFLLTIGVYRTNTYTCNNKNQCVPTTLIIPFCNEEAKLDSLFDSLKRLNFPKDKLQIIFVDDHSSDNSYEMVLKFSQENKFANFIIYQMQENEFGKKTAVEKGVTLSQNELIVLTDADCFFNQERLWTINNFFMEYQPELIICPVIPIISKNIFFQILQIEYWSLIGTTIGSCGINRPLMCNGANLVFRKSTFLKLDPFKNNKNIKSGDDQFLLEAIMRNFPNKIKFLKSIDAAVYTSIPSKFNEFLNQRIRWASKTKYSSSFFIKFVAVVVFLYNFSIAALILVSLLSLNIKFAFITLLFLTFKICIDFPLLWHVSTFLKKRKNLFLFYFPTQIFYVFYVSLIGIWANINSKFNWKH